MIAHYANKLGVREYEYGRRVIALAATPRRRDFLKVLFGTYRGAMKVYEDEIPTGGIRRKPIRDFGGVMTEAEHDFAVMAAPSDFDPRSRYCGPKGAEEELAKVRELAGIPSPV